MPLFRSHFFLVLWVGFGVLVSYGFTAEPLSGLILGRSSRSLERWNYPHNIVDAIPESPNSDPLLNSSVQTTDSIEKVVLWYAHRVGLAAGDSLVESAKQGFSNLESRLNINSGLGHETEERKSQLSILGTVSAEHSHVTIVLQQDLEKNRDVIISIAQAPSGANIHVFRQDNRR